MTDELVIEAGDRSLNVSKVDETFKRIEQKFESRESSLNDRIEEIKCELEDLKRLKVNLDKEKECDLFFADEDRAVEEMIENE